VERLSSQKINAPGYVIVANPQLASPSEKYGQGVVITRSRTGVDNYNVLDPKNLK